ncbi:hypothetical protein [Sulfolobus tengchongensis spindle-shaped virus 4]|nr:hypothetical protein [Sulfolobus tengchongensis spindle-shaped virus 4]
MPNCHDNSVDLVNSDLLFIFQSRAIESF